MTPAFPARVLYIEDDPSLCDLFSLSVQAAGYTVRTATSGKQGLELFRSEPFDVVAIDHQLPDMTGIEVGRSLLKENPYLPLLLITGKGSEKLVAEAFSAGFNNYTIKEDTSVYLELIPGIIHSLMKSVEETKQRLQAEQQLIEKERQLQSIFENSAVGMISFDSAGIIETANPTVIRLFGYAEQELIGARIDVLDPPENETEGPSVLASLQAADGASLIGKGRDVMRRRKDGSLVPVHMVISEANIGSKKTYTALLTDLTERVETERARELLELGLENIDEALALYDKDDFMIYCNHQYRQDHSALADSEMKPGTPFPIVLAAIISKKIYKTNGMTEEAFFEYVLSRHYEASEPYELETRDGRWKRCRKYRTPEGGYVFLSQDITSQKLADQKTRSLNEELEERVRQRTEELVDKIEEQKRIEEALRTSETRVRTIVESVNDGIITIDENNRIESFNSSAQTMFGYHLDDVLGTDFTNLIAAPKRQERRKEPREDSPDRRKDDSFRPYQEIRAIRKDRSTFPVELNLNELLIGDTLRYVGTVRDLTERRAAEKARREIEARFRAVVDSSPSSISLRDKDGVLLVANKQWHEWFNPDNRDITGMRLSEFFGETHDKVMTDVAREIFATKKPRAFEFDTPLPDGSVLSSYVQMFPVFDTEGAVTAVGGMNTDITERVKAERERREALAQAEKANQAKSDFLASMSHELRTPLNAIQGFSEIIAHQVMGPITEPKYVAYADDIHKSSKLLLSLVNDILDLSAIESGTLTIDPENVNIPAVYRECVTAIEAELASENISITLSGDDPALLNYPVDRAALSKILSNLLSNAIQATPPGGTIHIEAGLSDNHLQTTVTDTGCGIPADKLELMHQAFVRGEADPHHAHGGAGLGLTIVQSLVDLHGGTLEIASQPGKGTSVTFTLMPLS